MIRFDNGPPDGDYVRYIDELMAQRAASLVAVTMTSDADGVDRMRAADGRKKPMSAAMTSPAFKSSHERARDAKSGVGVSTKPHASTGSSSSSDASAFSPAVATAIASAMIARDTELDPLPGAGKIVGAAGVTLGAIQILIGTLGPTANVVLIVAGIALVSWAIKRLGARPRPSGIVAPLSSFTTPPTQRASSGIKVKGRP